MGAGVCGPDDKMHSEAWITWQNGNCKVCVHTTMRNIFIH